MLKDKNLWNLGLLFTVRCRGTSATQYLARVSKRPTSFGASTGNNNIVMPLRTWNLEVLPRSRHVVEAELLKMLLCNIEEVIAHECSQHTDCSFVGCLLSHDIKQRPVY